MPNINGIINRSNIAKLGTKKHKVIDKCNCRDKVRCPLEGKCKQECVVYKVEVYSDSNNKRNKKIYKGILKLGTITIEQVSRTRSIGIALHYLVMCGNLRKKTRSRSYNEIGSNKEMPQI